MLIRTVKAIIRTYGTRGLARRATFEGRRALGLFPAAPRELAPPAIVAHGPYAPSPQFETMAEAQRQRVIARAERTVAGEFDAFGGSWRRLPKDPRSWRTHPNTAHEFPEEPWWRLALLPFGHDIKDVWEPARFSWVYDLCAAYALTRDYRFAKCFENVLRQWCDANPPFRGPGWACGQETAIRALAILHAEATFGRVLHDTDVPKLLSTVLSNSGERIWSAVGYGLSQRNNHGISEAAGMVHLGYRLAQGHPKARMWLRCGQAWLREQVLDQFAGDGWYAQHSFTYMRLALEQALAVQRCLAYHGDSLPTDCLDRLRAATKLLTMVVCEKTGVVPNYGANDGGRALLYSTAPYRDFRPVLTHAAVTLGLSLPADVTPDSETAGWLGACPEVSAPRGDAVWTGASGWAVGRVAGTSIFMRAGKMRHRPSHLDSLHIDVRRNGIEVVTDPGTYAYNGQDPKMNRLSAAALHNGPVVDGKEPGVMGPRFLWYTWPVARLVKAALTGGSLCLAAELLDGNSGQPIVRREVTSDGSSVEVVDAVVSPGARSLQVTWLLHPSASCVQVSTEPAAIEVAAGQNDAIGWFSPTYGVREVTRALRITSSPPKPIITALKMEW